MKRSTQIVLLTVGFLCGIALASYYLFSPSLAWLILAIFGSILALRIKSKLGYAMIFGLGLMLGIWRIDLAAQLRPSPTIDDLRGQKVELTGSVVGEPSWNEYGQFVFYLDQLAIGNQPIAGSIKVSTMTGNALEGYRMHVAGKLYSALGRTSVQLIYAKSDIVSIRVPMLIAIKQSFARGLGISLGQPAAGFMMGILVGARSALPKEIQGLLATIGLSHIVAVSGYNLTILIIVVNRLFGRKWRWGGLVGSLWLSVGFVAISGASASIVRAAVMSGIFLLCRYYGRRLDMLAGLALGALVTVGYNPSYLLSDLGWQLSFLSLAGIVLLAPTITSLLPKRLPLLSELVAVSLSAQLATAPLLAFKFGYVSIVGPLANLLIMPTIPLLMLLGFAAGIIGLVLPGLAFLLMSPVRFAVQQILDVVRYLASWSWSKAGTTPLPTQLLIISYAMILLMSVLFARRSKTLQTSKLI